MFISPIETLEISYNCKVLQNVSYSVLLQTARWKVTSKEALQRIGEYSEAAITIRGTYFPPGKEPKEGERKIYLAIESMYQKNNVSVETSRFVPEAVKLR